MRINKGKRLEQHIDDYTIIDLETCGISSYERNHIIELSGLKVRGGDVVDEFTSLTNPQCCIPQVATDITGIDNDMVINAPILENELINFLNFIGDDVIVGYNINTFDYNIIYDLAESIYNRTLSNDFVDIIYAAKRTICDIDNYKLTTICSYFALDIDGAHRALKDCYLTKAAYDELFNRYGECAFDGSIHTVDSDCQKRGFTTHYSEETQQLRELQNILSMIIDDSIVTEDEVDALVEWMNCNVQLRGNYPYDRVFNLLEAVLEDGVVDNNELKLLYDKFLEFTKPSQSTCNNIDSLASKHFVITGEFKYGSRNSVEEYITSKGGIIDSTVKKCTNYVVIGALGSQAWKNGVYGSKIKKAMELKDKGQNIDLVAEDDFFSY